MSNVKSLVVEMMKSLPDDCSWEDVQYHIYVREKIERGMAAVDAGEVITQEEAERNIGKWLKSSGQNQQ